MRLWTPALRIPRDLKKPSLAQSLSGNLLKLERFALYRTQRVEGGGSGEPKRSLLILSKVREMGDQPVDGLSRVGCVESAMTHRSPATSLPARRPHRRCVYDPNDSSAFPRQRTGAACDRPGNLVRCPLLTYDPGWFLRRPASRRRSKSCWITTATTPSNPL